MGTESLNSGMLYDSLSEDVRERYGPGELAKASRDLLTVYYALVAGRTFHRGQKDDVTIKRIDDIAKYAEQKIQQIIALPQRKSVEYLEGVILPLAQQLPQEKQDEIMARDQLIAACNRVKEMLQPKTPPMHTPKPNPFAF